VKARFIIDLPSMLCDAGLTARRHTTLPPSDDRLVGDHVKQGETRMRENPWPEDVDAG
jgi:hypothetical protein